MVNGYTDNKLKIRNINLTKLTQKSSCDTPANTTHLRAKHIEKKIINYMRCDNKTLNLIDLTAKTLTYYLLTL